APRSRPDATTAATPTIAATAATADSAKSVVRFRGRGVAGAAEEIDAAAELSVVDTGRLDDTSAGAVACRTGVAGGAGSGVVCIPRGSAATKSSMAAKRSSRLLASDRWMT